MGRQKIIFIASLIEGSWKIFLSLNLQRDYWKPADKTGTPLSTCSRMSTPSTHTHHSNEIWGGFIPVSLIIMIDYWYSYLICTVISGIFGVQTQGTDHICSWWIASSLVNLHGISFDDWYNQDEIQTEKISRHYGLLQPLLFSQSPCVAKREMEGLVTHVCITRRFNLLWPNDTIWWHTSRSVLAQVPDGAWWHQAITETNVDVWWIRHLP